MTEIAMSSGELLFSDAEGKPTSLEDLTDDGLDGVSRSHSRADRAAARLLEELAAWPVATVASDAAETPSRRA